ncbi:Zn-dependent hydrolase [Chthonobacter albigriseus]|uniref:Zn-dependent hydrolase n=1 Tax=Chthonobacter albigriseus TaxID=1683161 RepID=UPI0015EE87DB|nr:Zn-dependent hydrolase [Chthonobacter albigriseus]
MTRNLSVRPDRIAADIEALAEITDPDRPWTRRAFTPRFLQGRAWVDRAFRAAGLETRIDAAGNLIGRRAGRREGLGTIVVGSHTDTVPDGGRYDGIAGVVAGLEIARALADRGIALDHDLEVIDCLAEEVSIFGVSCIGSRAAAGVLPAAWLERSAESITLAEGIASVGGDPGVLESAKRDDISAFLELHIEQGPVLEREKLDVGIVTAIAGITRIEVEVAGRADHAGTTPMDARADALVAAAGIVLAVREIAIDLAGRGDGHFAATVGEFSIEPGAANVVPSSARLLIDARAEARGLMETFLEALSARCRTAETPGIIVGPPRVLSDNPPTPSDPALLDEITAACDGLDVRHRRMASGAGHDMAWFARIAPAAMVFVPCRGGRSHAPDEWADSDAIALGAEVLLETILRLDRRASNGGTTWDAS